MRYILAVVLISISTLGWCDVGIQINGISSHFGECEDGCNEVNYGAGLDVSKDKKFLMAGILKNSVNDVSAYLGAGPRIHKGLIGASLFMGAVYYPSSEYKVVPAILPILSIGPKWAFVSVTYIPPVTDEVVGALLFNLTVRVKR